MRALYFGDIHDGVIINHENKVLKIIFYTVKLHLVIDQKLCGKFLSENVSCFQTCKQEKKLGKGGMSQKQFYFFWLFCALDSKTWFCCPDIEDWGYTFIIPLIKSYTYAMWYVSLYMTKMYKYPYQVL